jgi:hypothetical protein
MRSRAASQARAAGRVVGARAVGLGLACAALVGACTDANLFGRRAPTTADRLAFKGSLCTSDPAERAFPVRVLFLVDTSIGDADYISGRGDSIDKLALQFAGPNYSYGVIRYAGPLKGTTCGLRNLTPDGFTKDIEDAVAGVRCVDNGNPGRNLIDTLSLASSFVSGDILTTKLGVRSRTKYVVVLLSNGPPSASLESQWCQTRGIMDAADCTRGYFDEFCADVRPPPASCERNQYVRLVRELKQFALDNGVQDFFFHSVYQRDPDAAMAARDDASATALLSELALAGGGTLYRFPGASRCDLQGGDSTGCLFSRINIDSTEAVFQRRQLIVSNRSAIPTARGLEVDSDQDGLPDRVEAELGTSPTSRDTDGDQLGDRIEVLLQRVGLNPLVNQDLLTSTTSTVTGQTGWPVECPRPGGPSPNAFPPDQDLDGDRLTDCEEILLRTNATLFDSDADGVPDPLEFRMGTNPLADDGLLDTDNDGLANIDEHRIHLDPLSRDPNTDKAYTYEFTNEARKDVLSFTQPLPVTGVTIFEASASSREGRGTIVYRAPADPSREVGPDNPAYLSWKDPQDDTPGPLGPGRGAEVEITGDGLYVLSSAGSVPGGDPGELSITVDVAAYLLPFRDTRSDVRLRLSTRSCFDFSVSNVLLVPTLALPDTEAGMNFIDVFLGEVPSNNPGSYGVFRIATYPAKYPEDPRARAVRPDIELIDQDFLLFGD